MQSPDPSGFHGTYKKLISFPNTSYQPVLPTGTKTLFMYENFIAVPETGTQFKN